MIHLNLALSENHTSRQTIHLIEKLKWFNIKLFSSFDEKY